MDIKQTAIPGCYEIEPVRSQDLRGCFVKTFHEDLFVGHKLVTHFAEEYYTFSHQGVLRGLHFQVPPQDHIKLVYCPWGEVMDAVVDLRVGSPAYGRYELFRLSADKGNLLYLPAGLAHGFYVLSRNAVLLYKVTTVYAPECDTGIRWDSAGIPWPDANPTISQRDREFGALAEFASPFVFQEG